MILDLLGGNHRSADMTFLLHVQYILYVCTLGGFVGSCFTRLGFLGRE